MRGRSNYGWLKLIEGILLLVLGIYTLTRPDEALTGFIILYGIVAVITGISDIILYVEVARFIGFGPVLSLITGTLSVMAGVMLIITPNAGKWVMSLLFPVWFIAHCISRLANVNWIHRLARPFHYYMTMILNIIGLVLGVLMLLDPVLTWVSVQYVISFYLIALGIDCIVLACSRIGEK